MIKETNLKKVINNVAMKNKDDLLENNINFLVEAKDVMVLTDSKWLEYIINQIVSNSIKYIRNDVDSIIKLQVEDLTNQINLHIYDNGIGIPEKDIRRVFEKTFTGENGRNSQNRRNGPYIVKKLCEKLGHKISIESVQRIYRSYNSIF